MYEGQFVTINKFYNTEVDLFNTIDYEEKIKECIIRGILVYDFNYDNKYHYDYYKELYKDKEESRTEG